jgi:uncharacterized membrane protein YdbT with pleckstrin-like domain
MEEPIYTEEVRSTRTSALFAGFAVIFLVLFAWRYSAVGWKFTPGLFLFLAIFFLFYLINYRILRIRITHQALRLQFGLVNWTSDLENIRSCQLDDPPLWIKYGGAGVHFAQVGGIYRAFYNFLEHPRVLVVFWKKQGLVQGISFTTRQPERILEVLEQRRVNRAE